MKSRPKERPRKRPNKLPGPLLRREGAKNLAQTNSEPPRNPPQQRPNRRPVRRPTEVRSRRLEVTPAATGFLRVSQRNPRRVSGSQTTYKRTGSAWRKNSRRTWPRKTSLKGQRLSAKLCYSLIYTSTNESCQLVETCPLSVATYIQLLS